MTTLQDFINKAHDLQVDAGSHINFTKKFTYAHEKLIEEGMDADPVAAFLAALVIVGGGDFRKAIESMDFYFDEIKRIHEGLLKFPYISDQRREDMIVGALEGGSNYWYYLKRDACNIIDQFCDDKNPVTTTPLSIRMWQAIKNGAIIPVHDLEDLEGDPIGEISLETMNKREALMKDEEPEHFEDIINETDDATTADIWFQYQVLGEIVYG